MDNPKKLNGFGNYFQSEACVGALPIKQNSPQKVPYDLYAEQINGSAFTCPRDTNHFVWTYKLQPSVVHSPYILYKNSPLFQLETPYSPNQYRYNSLNNKKNKTLSFVEGLIPIAANKISRLYTYQLNQAESLEFFVNHDGEFLFVAQEGELMLFTELGRLQIAPGEIAVIPKGIKFQVSGERCYGYICESLNGRFKLPDLGPIGANGLANPHDFIYPNAAFVNKTLKCKIISLYQNHLWVITTEQHPLNTVAWRGNYLPYKYDLSTFNTINTVSFDHPDPSIFTVLTVPSLTPGVANIDFVIFPERWMVAEDTFRPPYFHRNCMSEFMGLIKGNYDAKSKGFSPGGFSIHNAMTAHGPDNETYQKAIKTPLITQKITNTLAFMFESNHTWNITKNIANIKQKEVNYLNCWQGL